MTQQTRRFLVYGIAALGLILSFFASKLSSGNPGLVVFGVLAATVVVGLIVAKKGENDRQ
ncbi:hypothetical protein [Streptomyces sp. NPDC046197]|uniref:hypothetical protein n=1 Tax=Streptomyces sp. NPDC046197 TaxID=3154337 RepID=UPI0033D4D09F